MNEQGPALKLEVLKRVHDLAASDRTSTAVALVDAALTLLAQQFPAELNDEGRKLVQENYPPATNELISERAMSDEGVALALAAGVQMAQIAIDYSPLSNAKREMDGDFKLPRDVMQPVVLASEDVIVKARNAGLSDFGTAALMIHLAAHRALEHGVSPLKVARPLLEALGKVLDSDRELSSEDVEERAIAALREQMGISREVAKRYIKMAKQQRE